MTDDTETKRNRLTEPQVARLYATMQGYLRSGEPGDVYYVEQMTDERLATELGLEADTVRRFRVRNFGKLVKAPLRDPEFAAFKLVSDMRFTLLRELIEKHNAMAKALMQAEAPRFLITIDAPDTAPKPADLPVTDEHPSIRNEAQ